MSPDGGVLAAAAPSGTTVWPLGGAGDSVRLATPRETVLLQFSDDGARLVAGGDGRLSLWDARTGRQIADLSGMEGKIAQVAFAPRGNRIVGGGQDGRLRIWNAADGTLLATVDAHQGPVGRIAFRADGVLMASGGADGTARLWRVADGGLLATLVALREPIVHLAFSPDGTTLAVAAGIDELMGKILLLMLGRSNRDLTETQVRLFDTATGRLIETFDGHRATVADVLFLGDGRQLVTTDHGGVVKVWPCHSCRPVSELKRAVAGRVGRPLDGAEQSQFGLAAPAIGAAVASAPDARTR
jgi:WD40 repeat protein